MKRILVKSRAYLALITAVFVVSVCIGTEPNKAAPEGLEGVWDPARYISIDEVRPGMEAYALTVYKGTEIEKFPLEVISVVYDISPGRNAILVRGTDERFIHTGPVAGCSGSPVYINGRLAGALAFGWTFSKDPLYGVTTIEDMLRVGRQINDSGHRMQEGPGLTFDFSKPIDFSTVPGKISTGIIQNGTGIAGATALPSPLVVSGLADSAKGELDGIFGRFGMMTIPGGGSKTAPDVCDAVIAPGSCLTVPLVAGDITLDVIGTVTEVRDNEVYGFGHSFLGYGEVDLPMATGQVHTVMSSVMRSFKVATSLNIVGALTTDESRAVRGRMGAKAKMVPLTLRVNRYNDPETRVYNCQIADNRLLTPLLLRAVISGTTQLKGNLPPDNTIEYKGSIVIDDAAAPPVVFENISTARELEELIQDSVSPIALLMNNPFSRIKIKSIALDISVREKNILAGIWSATLSKSKVKPGENFSVQVITESFQAEKRSYTFDFEIPRNAAAGNYQLIICGAQGYEDFLRKSVPHRLTVENIETLIEAMNVLLAIGRDELHCILVLPQGGIAVEKTELPELPATKALILNSAKRTYTIQAFPGWIEKKTRTANYINDQKIMNITVEQ